MKSANCEGHELRKRRRCASPHSSAPETGYGYSCKRPLQRAHTQWEERANFIDNWAYKVAANRRRSASCDSISTDGAEVEVPGIMSDSSRLRDMKERRQRSRSSSPTKKSPQYRNTVLKPANILIDVIHDLSPDIEALLPHELRDIFNPPPPTPPSAPHTHVPTGSAHEHTEGSNATAKELAAIYRDECRELAGKPGSEPEYRTHLFGDVVEKLARLPYWRRVLSANCSDKLWCSSLKPPAPTPFLSLPWLPMSLNPIAAKRRGDASFESTQDSFNSNGVRVRPDCSPCNYAVPPASTEPSESSTSELDGTITTPEPDITVGISREAFDRTHADLLEYWQAGRTVFSDPHVTQGDMRFPFLLIENKGLATSGNLIGAQNQAAGGGTCAIRLLRSLGEQDPGNGAPRIVFSVTTEGPIKELWVHYWVVDENNILKYHMTCLGAWRTTLHRHADEFVAALASIFRWAVEVFVPQIKLVLDRFLEAAIAAR